MKVCIIPLFPGGTRHLPRQSNASSTCSRHSVSSFPADNLMQIKFEIIINNYIFLHHCLLLCRE